MIPSIEPLVDWARSLWAHCAGNRQLVRERLEYYLRPMIHCALRTGVGQPSLVNWVEYQVASVDPAVRARTDGVQFAAGLARVLSERLVTRLDPLPGRETVIGP
jgi:hypothetical protein